MTYNDVQKRATEKYKKANYKRIPLDVPTAFYDNLKNAADQAGESVNGFIKQSVNERIEKLTAEGVIEPTAAADQEEQKEE